MAWASKVTESKTNVSVEQFFTPIGLAPMELAVCEVEADFPAGPVDDLIVSIYASVDDAGAENWDDTPLRTRRLAKETDPHKVTIPVQGVYRFRVGVKRSGTTDVIPTVTFTYRRDGVSG